MMTQDQVTCPPSNAVGLERTRYFHRQLVGPEDLTQDQLYFREKSRRHNRMLHGWGVVCGARVKAGAEPCEVIVEPGYLLGPYGDEIVIDREVTVDLCAQDLDGNAVSPCGSADPWCADVQVAREAGRPYYLAVRYEECNARAVRVFGNGCGCDLADCQYSRTRDSFAIRVLDTLPSTYTDPLVAPSGDSLLRCPEGEDCTGISCLACPPEPWVVLADVTLEGGALSKLECDPHRRYVVSFASFFFTCGAQFRPQPGGGGVVLPGRPGRLTLDQVRASLGDLLHDEAITRVETEHNGDLVAVAALPATEMTGVTAESAVGRALEGRTIADVADTPQEEFVASMLEGVPASRRTAVTNQANLVWSRAAILSNLASR
jgi:hypothetical protein